MRYVLIALGLVTTALAVMLAVEGLWFAAIPAAFFGLGIPWVAWVSLQDERRQDFAPLPAAEPAAVAPAPPPAPEPPPPTPESPPVSPPLAPRPAPRPVHAGSRAKHRKRR